MSYLFENGKIGSKINIVVLKGDYSKAKKRFAWQPEVKFQELVKMMMVDVDLNNLS